MRNSMRLPLLVMWLSLHGSGQRWQFWPETKAAGSTMMASSSTQRTIQARPIHLPEVHQDKFYYFGYGSNLLAARIHIQNPTAIRIGKGVLQDFRLDFNMFTSRWNGAPATILPTANRTVWGAVWEIDLSNLSDIDDQEGVTMGIYEPISITVSLANGTTVSARSYMLIEQPVSELNANDETNRPFERQPSQTYLQCMVQGALETGLPDDYVAWLRSIKHNGRRAVELELRLGLANVML